MKFSQLYRNISEHIYMDHDPDFLPVVMATALSIQLDTEGVWLLVLAPPSSGKSMVSLLSKSSKCVMVSTLTPNSLISGARAEDCFDGKDPSLLPQLDGKIMVIKDASTISSMPKHYRDAIFSQLRSAYDGDMERKATGLGSREFSSKFAVIIAGTPDFERSRTLEGNLGERFLTFRPSSEHNSPNVWAIINRSIGKKKKYSSGDRVMPTRVAI